ncbi:hypothetical protein NQ156_15020 [Microbacterium sp. zg.Y625]|uniref:hypothetical protein n=1 Tax=Microbacterium jiangjiandongii TaxID=3049071 RepID=UPI00214C0462|nr:MULTISPECIES: hypothetical protein [unclassified Microbacterium]MCR2794379.1 hypothetical protein [Microbacterium sp. zg.Y625]MCR2815961.1 hypothetical protein [Microbacterium sp. zg.Y843]WIM26291.1 hypothetical protein QNO14_04350 [Microbacterium sp. zg-Y625]
MPGRDAPVFDDLLPGEDAATSTEAVDADAGEAPAASSARVNGWGRVFRTNRALWIIAAAAVLSLTAGLLVGRFVLSPADAASLTDPPEPGLITVAVERGILSNDVTIRGDVGYADSVEVTIDTGALGGPAVVTGSVPEVGATLEPLSVALEVAGRPVIVLPGELPAYRTLVFGLTGPDVVQFKEAMRAVGIDAGDPASDVFDAAAAAAVTELYAQVGYPAPAAEEGAADAVLGAQEGMRAAEQAVAAARADLGQASGGASPVDIRAADNAVNSAQRALDVRMAQRPAEPAEVPAWEAEVSDLRDALDLRRLERSQLDATPDTSGQRAAVEAAERQLAEARQSLERAREQAMPSLSAAEVLYLSELPRRVDAVNVARGQVLQGAAMIVSGAAITVVGAAAPADAALLEVGGEATFELADGTPHRAVISALTPGATQGDRWEITLQPDELTTDQAMQLQGRNVRVSLPVGATAGEVLFVPVAALTAGPGGEARVEVVDGDPRDGDDATTRVVVVTTGLAAGGFVEVAPVEDDLAAGDLVVVGR